MIKKNADIDSAKTKRFQSSLFDTVKVKVRIRHENLYLLRQQHPKRIFHNDGQYKVRGKHKGTFAIIGNADGGEALYIEGSMPRFLTGQNLVGHEDLMAGAIEMIGAVLRRARISPTAEEQQAYRAGDFELLRVDYANHLWCGSARRAQYFMAALRRHTVARSQDYTAYKKETLYWRQHSSRQTLKAYDKGRQIAKKPMGPRVYATAALTKRAAGLIRFELTLRADELKRLGLRDPSAWTAEVARRMLDEKVREVLPTEGRVPNEVLFGKLSRGLRQRLELWLRGGTNAFTDYPGSFAKSKKEVMEKTGIDIMSVATPAQQARAFCTLREMFDEGWGYQCWKKKWEKMKRGKKE